MPVAAIIAEWTWLLGLAVYCLIRMPHKRRARREKIRVSKQDHLDIFARKFAEFSLGVAPLVYVVTKFPAFGNYTFQPLLLPLGAAALAAALWCVFRAHKDLGRAFSNTLQVRQDHPLVTAGIYRHVRHPMYLGFLLWMIAQNLLLPNWFVAALGSAGWILLFASRVTREEQMMLREFGDQYRTYMGRTARLIPGIF
jgi:protein-S-isoprenylcysteine O-methyltransferase Ste14